MYQQVTQARLAGNAYHCFTEQYIISGRIDVRWSTRGIISFILIIGYVIFKVKKVFHLKLMVIVF
ncbi:hypothetical protein NV64_12640 [Erwinia sp. B116]|nr:hypothetical protein NV64_12640 [Erwinia sp. B116]